VNGLVSSSNDWKAKRRKGQERKTRVGGKKKEEYDIVLTVFKHTPKRWGAKNFRTSPRVLHFG